MPILAALLPLALTLAYTVAVLGAPGAPVAWWAGLAGDHFVRNLRLLPLLLCACLAAGMILDRDRRARPILGVMPKLRDRWASDRCLSILVPPLYLALLLASFTTFKQFILPAAGFGFDPLFAEADRLLLGGRDAWRITHALMPWAVGANVADALYVLWFFPLLLFVLCSWIAPIALRTQFLLAFTLMWILLGSLLAFLLPAGGPCYVGALHGGADFAPLMNRLHAQDAALKSAGGSGLLALAGQAQLLDAYQKREMIFVGGISAMPSLHNALAVLFACAAYRMNRAFGRAMALFAAAIFFASIHLGWHYAVDGIAGGALAICIWRLSGVATRRLLAIRLAPAAAAFPAPA